MLDRALNSNPNMGTPRSRGTGRTTSRTIGRGRKTSSPWINQVHVPWVPGFLPLASNQGYAAMRLRIASALKLDPSDGGWLREKLPTLVLSYDSSNAQHRKILESLDTNVRFVAGAHLFNCFRLEVTSSSGEKIREVVLTTYRKDGTLVGEVRGSHRLRGGYALLSRAVQEDRSLKLSKLVPRLKKALSSLAQIDAHVKAVAPLLIDPKTGKVDPNNARSLKRAQEVAVSWRKVLEVLKLRSA